MPGANMLETVSIPKAALVATVDACLLKLGISESDTAIVREVLMYAQTRGNAQGLAKIVERTVMPDPDAGTIAVAEPRGATLHIDGNRNLGMVVCERAAREAAALAAKHGIAFVGTCNTSSSTGAIGYYAAALAREGCIAIVLAGSPKVVAMEGGIDPVFGTNPIAIAVPTDNEPLVLDMATAAIAWFTLIEARDQGRAIAGDLAFDADGNPTADPQAAMAGAIRTFGGYKGAGLSMMAEILTGPLVGADIVGEAGAATNRGAAFIAIKPSFVVDEDHFKKKVSRLCVEIRNGRLRPGVDQILMPGERGRRRAVSAAAGTGVPVDAALYKKLVELASS